jgi:hypothetical protein
MKPVLRSAPAARWRRVLETLANRLSVWAPMLVVLFPSQRAAAATLPEERADALYHLYDGGGQTVQGPALLLRKNFAEKVSLTAGYYIDQISGASIDVITNASPYHEERREITAGTDYLYRDTLMSVGYTDSNEHDYKAKTWNASVSQDMFENRTTLTLGFYQGNDNVGKVNSDLSEKANRNGYSVSLAQVINPTLIGNLTIESTAADGYLENPYRFARQQGASVQQSFPGTRTGEAVAVKLLKSWSESWSTRLDARYYWDSWHIGAADIGIGASHYIHNNWILDGSYRFYTQKAASFYSDDFPKKMDYMTRDKEYASFNSHTLGTKLTVPLYLADPNNHSLVNNVSVSFAFDYMMIDYKNFTDVRNGALYGFNASIAQLFFTVRY